MKRSFFLFVSVVSSLLVSAQNSSKIELLKSKETTDYVWVAAHRADYVFAPENSIQALENAIYFGADLIETDVRLTKDGQVVMMHDYTVDRMTNGTGRVSDRSAKLEKVMKPLDDKRKAMDDRCKGTARAMPKQCKSSAAGVGEQKLYKPLEINPAFSENASIVKESKEK